MLGAVALDTTGEIRVVRAALHELGVDQGALLAAEVSGILHFAGDRVDFIDPARRSQAAAALTSSQRRAMHGVLAGVLTEPRHRSQRAEHLASAAVGPDREAALALAELGTLATERGELAEAGELYMRAGGLSPDPEDRAANLLKAGDACWNSGEYTAARAAFDAAYSGSIQPVLRADIALQLGQLDMYQRGPRYGRDLLVAAADAVEPHDPDRAAMLLLHAASAVMLSSDVAGSLGIAHRACALAARGDGTTVVPASLILAFLSRLHGDRLAFDAVFPGLSELAEAVKDTDAPEADLFLQLVGMSHVYAEHWDAGRSFLTALAHRAERRSRSATAALASATLAELCWRSGRWDEAWTLATSDLVTGVTLVGARLWLLAFTAHLDSGYGRADDCRMRARAALSEGEPKGFGTTSVWAYHALGLLELGLGHPVAAAAHLDHLDAIATAHEIVDPNVVWWQADHVEALVRSGRRHEAARALKRFAASAELCGGVWASATTWRCHALLAGSIEDAERCFAESLGEHDGLAAPFELARTLLCRAERRVSAGALLDPAADLSEAIAIFDALGAASWSAQGCALRDTIASGGEATDTELLSPAERRVADAVASGMSNREVAATLYVSERTVEFHLHNVYRKLDVHSRTQLVRRLPRR